VVVRLEQLTPAVFDQATASQMTQELLDQWLNEEVERRLVPIRASLPAPAPQVPQALGEANPAAPAAQPSA
jgi:hypothetical protein